MIVGLRVEVNAIAVAILMILILNMRRTGKNMLDEKLYQILLWLSLCYAFSDMVAWILDGSQLEYLRVPLYAVNVLCYLFCVIVPYIWSLYAEFRLFENEEQVWKINRFLAIPVAIYSVLVIATPWTGWMFSFNESQMYVRGSLFILQVILSFFYAVFPTLRAMQRLRTASVSSERRECYNIAGFVLFPILGLGIQVLFFGMPTAIIATVIAELMIFVNLQNKQISLDSLTGLNNRGQFNRYLNVQIKKEFRTENLYMLLLDIDRFKLINDTFGHKEGDNALIDMSKILQRVCDRQGGFLSRFGGDEFAIIIEKQSDEEVVQLVEQVQEEIRTFNENKTRKYELSASIGYALFGTDTTKDIDQLLEAADTEMYKMKLQRHSK